jgi:hypothetical protein
MSRASKIARRELKTELLETLLLTQSEPIGTRVEFSGPKKNFIDTVYMVMREHDIKNISILSTSDENVVFFANTKEEDND